MQLCRSSLLKSDNIGLPLHFLRVNSICMTAASMELFLQVLHELQIAQVYSPLIQCDGLLISVAALQQQEDANNCGLLIQHCCCVSRCYEWWRGCSIVFDEPKMRAHLIKCFEKGKLSRFPRTKKATPKRPAPQTIAITIYTVCMCKRPDSFDRTLLRIWSCVTDVVWLSLCENPQRTSSFVLVVLLYDLCFCC